MRPLMTPKAPKRLTLSPMVISTGPRMWGIVHMLRFLPTDSQRALNMGAKTSMLKSWRNTSRMVKYR